MKKVCVIICSRPNFGRLKSVLKAIQEHPDLELYLVVGISANYERYECLSIMERDGFKPDEEIKLTGKLFDDARTMPVIYGMFAIQLADMFNRVQPDMVLVHGDRFEMEAIAYTADCMNIPIAHTQGGELTGSIDDDVRFAITMHADIHFAATKESAERIRAILEIRKKSTDRVYNVGCPSIDLIREMDLSYSPVDGDYIVVINHSNTKEPDVVENQTFALLRAIEKLHHKTIWIGNNMDCGTSIVSQTINTYKKAFGDNNIYFEDSYSPEDFYRLIKHSKCLIGNTSAGIREGAYLNVPYVCLGTRQTNREHGSNVMFTKYDTDEICEGVEGLYGAEFEPDYRFGNGNSGKMIAEILGGM